MIEIAKDTTPEEVWAQIQKDIFKNKKAPKNIRKLMDVGFGQAKDTQEKWARLMHILKVIESWDKKEQPIEQIAKSQTVENK